MYSRSKATANRFDGSQVNLEQLVHDPGDRNKHAKVNYVTVNLQIILDLSTGNRPTCIYS